jgi:hypothetical protein
MPANLEAHQADEGRNSDEMTTRTVALAPTWSMPMDDIGRQGVRRQRQ